MKKKIIFIVLIIILLSILGVILYVHHKKDNSLYSISDIYITNKDGQKIYGKLYKPKKKNVPIVIYSHGLGTTYRVGEDYGDELIKHDIAVLTIDFRGGSSKSKSDGKTTEMSIMTELDDLRTVLNEVKTWDYVDKSKIIVMGGSQGGLVSALMSAEDQSINTAVLLYPALSLPSAVSNWYKSGARPSRVASVDVGENYFTDVLDLDVYDTISKDENNILLIHGVEDGTVSISVSEKANKIYKNVEFHRIEGAGHGFSGEYLEEALNYIIEYFKNNNIIE